MSAMTIAGLAREGGVGVETIRAHEERLLAPGQPALDAEHEHGLRQRLAGQAFRQAFVRQHHTVAQHIGNEVGHVFGQRIAASAQHGQGACAFHQADGGAVVEVLDDVVVVLVLAVGKREDSAAYTEAIERVTSGAREAVVKALRLGKPQNTPAKTKGKRGNPHVFDRRVGKHPLDVLLPKE